MLLVIIQNHIYDFIKKINNINNYIMGVFYEKLNNIVSIDCRKQ